MNILVEPETQMLSLLSVMPGFDPPLELIVGFWILVIAYLVVTIQAILLVARRGRGVEVPAWMFAIVLLPFLGAIGAAAHYKTR